MQFPHEATTFVYRVQEQLNRVDAERRSKRPIDPVRIIRTMQEGAVMRSQYALPKRRPDPMDQL